jgi:uncharacterized protein (TIGR02099 family)
VPHIQAGIAAFARAELTVQASASSDASKLLDLLRQSPLRKEHGETLANIDASGPADVTFDMLLPLHGGNVAGRTKGTVDLLGARLREKRWNLAFDDVRGRADYGDGGVAANQLAVRHDGQPGMLGLRAGAAFVRDKSQAFEADLSATMEAKTLLDRAGNLGWLRPYVEGRSPWTLAVTLPKTTGSAAQPSRLSLRSTLVGTTLDLPAPLRKPAGASLATSIDADLPMGEGEVRIAFANIAAMRARSRGDQTGLRVVLGSDRVDEAPPASGLVATGRTQTLELVDWIGLAESGKGGEAKGSGMPLRRVDLHADRLELLGGLFPDARVQLSPSTGGSNVVVSGPALAGTVVVPDADGAAITGRLERAYWRAPPKAPNANPNAPAVPDPHPLDPASIPPLSFDVADLRINALNLGKAVVRTRPTPTGMRFDQLQATSQQHRMTVTGEWSGMGATSRTRLGLDIDSQDYGALMEGLGFGGQVKGGAGKVRFDATWPGAPREFGARGVEGTLALDVQKGTLLEIEPGAGRVLGLLSIAQLPRRMLLDFRDFYSKGLAFNRVDGHVRLAQGKARTDDLSIDSPAANAVLNKPIGQLTAKTYRVTGPWKEPKVEVRKKVPPPAGSSAAADPSPNG